MAPMRLYIQHRMSDLHTLNSSEINTLTFPHYGITDTHSAQWDTFVPGAFDVYNMLPQRFFDPTTKRTEFYSPMQIFYGRSLQMK